MVNTNKMCTWPWLGGLKLLNIIQIIPSYHPLSLNSCSVKADHEASVSECASGLGLRQHWLCSLRPPAAPSTHPPQGQRGLSIPMDHPGPGSVWWLQHQHLWAAVLVQRWVLQPWQCRRLSSFPHDKWRVTCITVLAYLRTVVSTIVNF